MIQSRFFLALIIIPTFMFSQVNNVEYTYDVLNRLSRAEYPNGTVVIYTYDADGNRESRIVTSDAAANLTNSPTPPPMRFLDTPGRAW